jgi:hypothetical protein
MPRSFCTDDLIKNLATSNESSQHNDAIKSADVYLEKFENTEKLKNNQQKKQRQYPAQDHTGM